MIRLLTVFLLSLGLATSAMAQDQSAELLFRSQYENSPELPDGVAFWSLMHQIEFLRAHDPNLAAGWAQNEMGLSQVDAEKFMGQFAATYDAYNLEYMEISRELACSVNATSVPRDQIFPILEELDDSTYALAGKHLMQLKATVGEDVAARLQQALDTAKLNTSHTTRDHKAVYEKKGGNPEMTVARICERLSTLAQQEGE